MSGKNLKQKQQKAALVEQLKKTPIVQIAAEKLGIGRATYYLWRKQDVEFSKACDQAISEGALLINDLAESQLISAIKDKDFSAIRFWLSHHHKMYSNKLEISGDIRTVEEVLTPEQQKIVGEALRLAAGSDSDDQKGDSNEVDA